MDTRYSAAIHLLILISDAEEPMTSEEIADSVGTNPSYIRKITCLLKRKGILESHQGARGFVLAVPKEKLTLYEIYQAIYETDEINLFDLHRNPNDQCIVGKHIQPVLTETFRGIEEKAEQELKAQTLADCVERMHAEIRADRNG